MLRRKLVSGENLNRAISASTWNDLLSLLDYRDRNGLWSPAVALGVQSRVMPPHPNAVWAFNDTGSPLLQFAVAAISAPLIDPEQATGEFNREVVLSLVAPLANRTKAMAVTFDAIPYNQSGYVVTCGDCPCDVDIADEDHTHVYFPSTGTSPKSNFGGPWRIIWKPSGTGTKRCLLRLGDPCYERKVMTDGTLTAGSSAQCSFYINGADKGSETVHFNWMENGIASIATSKEGIARWFDDEEKWVMVAAEC